MAKQREPQLVHQIFVYASDAELNAKIAEHRAQHEVAHAQILAMHARRPLGAGKVQITFRVVDK